MESTQAEQIIREVSDLRELGLSLARFGYRAGLHHQKPGALPLPPSPDEIITPDVYPDHPMLEHIAKELC